MVGLQKDHRLLVEFWCIKKTCKETSGTFSYGYAQNLFGQDQEKTLDTWYQAGHELWSPG